VVLSLLWYIHIYNAIMACAVGERLISDNCKQILTIDIPSTLNLEPIPSSSRLYTFTSTDTRYTNYDNLS